MKEQYSYLLKSNKEITAHLQSIKADNFHKKVDEDLHNLCFEVAQEGNIELMDMIITRHPNLSENINTHRDSHGYSILQVASWYNHPEMVEFLINNGADDRRENDFLTALELICLNSKNPLTETTKAIIKSLLILANPTEVDTLLRFLFSNQEDYPGIYDIFSPIVQEFRTIDQSTIVEEYVDESDKSTEDDNEPPSKKVKVDTYDSSQELYPHLHFSLDNQTTTVATASSHLPFPAHSHNDWEY